MEVSGEMRTKNLTRMNGLHRAKRGSGRSQLAAACRRADAAETAGVESGVELFDEATAWILGEQQIKLGRKLRLEFRWNSLADFQASGIFSEFLFLSIFWEGAPTSTFLYE